MALPPVISHHGCNHRHVVNPVNCQPRDHGIGESELRVELHFGDKGASELREKEGERRQTGAASEGGREKDRVEGRAGGRAGRAEARKGERKEEREGEARGRLTVTKLRGEEGRRRGRKELHECDKEINVLRVGKIRACLSDRENLWC
ncbi:hypothetical protein R1flu_009069 [Riccia fluitans]|uniref:Uncharacterized protein n=1 Tax=Riccia fluitans TaxID=41844 RepID=A0ABD1Z422_9MARC